MIFKCDTCGSIFISSGNKDVIMLTHMCAQCGHEMSNFERIPYPFTSEETLVKSTSNKLPEWLNPEAFNRLLTTTFNPKITVTLENPVGSCPSCSSYEIPIDRIMSLTEKKKPNGRIMNIVIFDNNVDHEKRTYEGNKVPSDYDIDFSTNDSFSMKRNNDGYIVMFRISEFNEMDFNDLAWNLLWFVNETARPGEQVHLYFTDEIIEETMSSHASLALANLYDLGNIIKQIRPWPDKAFLNKIIVDPNWLGMTEEDAARARRRSQCI